MVQAPGFIYFPWISLGTSPNLRHVSTEVHLRELRWLRVGKVSAICGFIMYGALCSSVPVY